jgi:hypothetical protein
VVNGGEEERVHLVIDLAGSSRFWKTVRHMQHFDPATDTEALQKQVRRVPCEPQIPVQIDTENFNIAPVMSPGELDVLVRELIIDFTGNPQNDPALVDEYRELLIGLSQDWRQLWLRHGYSREGQPHYEAAIEQVRRRLHPNPRALVTASNEIGVNPIVVQRILNSLLGTVTWTESG